MFNIFLDIVVITIIKRRGKEESDENRCETELDTMGSKLDTFDFTYNTTCYKDKIT